MTTNNIKVITHRFIHSDGTDFMVYKPIDSSYEYFVQQMNLIDPHEGMIENIEWEIKEKGDYKWTMEMMTNLSSLIIVKEQIKRKNRFGRKITLKNQECAIWDMLQGCSNPKQISIFSTALCYLNPEAKTLFSL